MRRVEGVGRTKCGISNVIIGELEVRTKIARDRLHDHRYAQT